MSCIAVTGANGFVGRKLCQVLIENGHVVHAITRTPYQYLESADYQNFIIDEINASTDWCDILKGVDCVVHLAARVHVMSDSLSDPLSAYRDINTVGTVNLAQQALKYNVKRFVYISTIKVNGEHTAPNIPFTANDTCNPDEPYAISKYEAEQKLFELSSKASIDIVVIRPPLVYGPGVKANFLSMMRWVNNGIPLPLGAVKNKRSLIALDNLVDLIRVCAEHKAAANEIFLASDGEDLSLTQLLKSMAVALDKPSRLIPVPAWLIRISAALLGQKNISRRLLDSLQVDISKTCTRLNWKPPVRTVDALKETAIDFLSKK